MGAADGVPGISGGTIAFVTGIYEEFIHTIKQFGPSAFTAWRQGGWMALYGHLNLAFAIPLGLGIVTSLFSIAHLVTRSEEHTSELQSRPHLVCRLLLEKKNKETK